MVYQVVGQTLGLNSPTVSNFDLMMLTRQGVPRVAIDALANSLHLSILELTKYLQILNKI